MNAPVLDLDELSQLVRVWQDHGDVIVFTNGHFDLLHMGHLRYLLAARSEGDRLIVAINDDISTRQRKGSGRPIVDAQERAALVAGLRCVDAVTIFSGLDCRPLVETLHPDVYVKGADWNQAGGPKPPEAEVVLAYGGRVSFVDLVPERSTTQLIQRIVQGFSSTRAEPDS